MNILFLQIFIIIISSVYFKFAHFNNTTLNILVYLLIVSPLIIISYISDKKLKRSIQDICKWIDNITIGEFNYHLDDKKLFKPLTPLLNPIKELSSSLLKFNFEIQATSAQISAVSQELSQMVEDNNSFIKHLSNESTTINILNNESNSNINSTIDDIDHMVNMFSSIKSTSQSLKNTNIGSKNILSDSLDKISNLLILVNEIGNVTKAYSKSVIQLNDTSKEITSILEIVNNISNKTNLLALNASIESAKAGEFGKSFSVVAKEIENLSNGSKESVLKISNLLNKLTNEIEDVTLNSEKNLENVNEVLKYSKTIGDSLNSVTESYSNVEIMIEEIINLSDKEYDYALDINKRSKAVEKTSNILCENFNEIHQSIEDHKSSIDLLKKSSESLLTYEENLNKSVKNNDSLLEIDEKNIEALKDKVFNQVFTIQLLDKLKVIDSKLHKDLLDSALNKHDFIEAIWSNDINGKFIYSNPPAGIMNAKNRQWFKESIKGKIFVSSVYISSITKKPCITISIPIKNNDNSIAGVVAVDLTLHLNNI